MIIVVVYLFSFLRLLWFGSAVCWFSFRFFLFVLIFKIIAIIHHHHHYIIYCSLSPPLSFHLPLFLSLSLHPSTLPSFTTAATDELNEQAEPTNHNR